MHTHTHTHVYLMKIYRFYMSWHQNVVVQRKHWNAVRKIECSFISYFSALGCAAYRSIELLDDGKSMSLVAGCFYAAVYDGSIGFSFHLTIPLLRLTFSFKFDWNLLTIDDYGYLVGISKAAAICPTLVNAESHQIVEYVFFSTRWIQSKSKSVAIHLNLGMQNMTPNRSSVFSELKFPKSNVD